MTCRETPLKDYPEIDVMPWKGWGQEAARWLHDPIMAIAPAVGANRLQLIRGESVSQGMQ